MKNYEKQQLLSKLKVISNLDRQQRFSQKVFRQLRGKNALNNSSFNKGEYVSSRDHKKGISSAQVTPNNYLQGEQEFNSPHHSRVQQTKDEKKKKQQIIKFKKVTQCKQITDGGQSVSSPNLITYRNQFSQRRYLIENKTTKSPGNTFQTMLENNCKMFEDTKLKCRQCKNTIQQKHRLLDVMGTEVHDLKLKLQVSQQRFESLKKSVEPYINNVNLMSVIVDSLARKKQQNDQYETLRFNEKQYNNEEKEEVKVNMWLIKQSKLKDKKMQSQSYKFQCQIDKLLTENAMLRQEIETKDKLLKSADQRIKNAQNNNSVRQRLEMCREELYWFKLQYQQKNIEIRNYHIKIQQLKYKLNVLTSLIGCAIIFDIRAKENDKIHLTEVLNKIDRFENLVSSKMENINSLEYLKIMNINDYEQGSNEVTNKHKGKKQQNSRTSKIFHKNQHQPKKKNQRLYLPNYLIFLGEEAITSKIQHIVIKPELFIKIRSILDSKYIDYRLFGVSTSKFPQFCNSYLRNYEIQSSDKKPYLVSRQLSETQVKESNLFFLKHLMDQRIQDLPQVQIFRDCLLGKYEEDEIYFYLMCRHKLIQGSQLENFINSGDPSKLIKFDKAKRTVIKITEKFGRTIQNFICHHLNQRKITRGRQQFVRLYYVLKFLFLIYSKIRAKKIQQLKIHFNNSVIYSKKSTSIFLHFNEIIRKNFDFLTRSQICGMFRKTYALYESHKQQVQFYQCFVASSMTTIFLQQLMKFDQKLQFDCQDEEMLINFKNYSMTQKKKRPSKQLKMKKESTDRELNNSQLTSGQPRMSYLTDQMNQINELWPDTVYKLGNERLNKNYYELTNANPEKIRSKIQLMKFLLDVGHGHLIKQNIHMKVKVDFQLILSESIINMIQVLNRIQKHKIDYENQVNLASKKLGKFFKNKIYEFYNEMLQDINKIRKTQIQTNQKKKERETMRHDRISMNMS